MNLKQVPLVLVNLAVLCPNLMAQHLWWNLEGQRDATCLYGEITALATAPGIYYCGANWHPGEPAGGYCGIQHNGIRERRTIFSIWDTSPQLHPTTTEADPRTIFNRFGGEGEGGHTHMLWPWKTNETFRFFVQKQPGSQPETTDTRYYVYDREKQQWIHGATIQNPNGGKTSVRTIGGGLNSFLENFLGRDKTVVKLATYRLWLGKSLEQMHCLTQAKGDGIWGQLHDAYFLAEGDRTELDRFFAGLAPEYGTPVYGGGGKSLDPISNAAIPPTVIASLQNLPHAGKAAVPRESAGRSPVKVFILAGQSNMEGYGGINTLDELGEHPTLGGLVRKIRKDDGSFVERDDVLLYYQRGDQIIRGPLTVGQGAGPDRIGPELMFGIDLGDYYEQPVLLIKTAWGGKDLYCDFRPPSAGKPPYEIPGAPRKIGAAYRQMIAEVHACLDHLEVHFPQFQGRPHELCGFVWFQGWNDFCADRKIRQQVYEEYARNFAHLVQDLRTEFKVPSLPVVVGELGVDGEQHVNAEMAAFRAAQAQIASQPELKGTLGYVRTAPYWYAKLDQLPRKLEVEERRLREKLTKQLQEELKGRTEASDAKPMEQLVNAAFEKARKEDRGYLEVQREHDRAISHWECHYFGNARVYCLVGHGLAEAMIGLQEAK
jgi:hypothetical protein